MEKENVFFFQDKKNIGFYPFIITKINNIINCKLDKDYFDIDTAPGYGGIFFSTKSEIFKKKFYEEFKKYCLKENIIAEFLKSNPVYKNEIFFNNMELNNFNILINLKRTMNELWTNAFGYSVRRNVKLAENYGLTVTEYRPEEMNEKLFKDFITIYNSTMTRNKASKNYYYDFEFIKKLSNKLKKNILFFFTTLKKKNIACEMILIDKNYSYSFLGGSIKDELKYKPNDLLKFNLIKKLKELKIKKYCIGGGIKINDSLFKFKQNYARDSKPEKFFISKKIHNKTIFEKIRNTESLNDSRKFLFYRN